MLKKSTLTLSLLLAGFIGQSKAQLFSDAYRFSNSQYYGTARSAAVGNALSALGGDAVCANINPAGLAIFRSSEFTITPMYSLNRNNAEFQNEEMSAGKNKFSIGNIGLVIAATPRMNSTFFQHGNFGITYNATNYFHEDMSFSGVSNGTRLTNFVNAAQGLDYYELNPFESQLAYDVRLIDDTAPYTYAAALDDNNIVRKSQFQRQRGASREIGLSYASHIKHKLYLGATLGITVNNYKEFKSYEEFEETGSIDFKQMVFDETREVKGTGINLKLGAIYRFNKILKAGLHIHTPTSNSLTETYYTEMFGAVIYNGNLEQNTFPSLETGTYKFRVSTPWIFGLSTSAVIGTKGYIGLEAEYLDYSSIKFKTNASDQTSTSVQYLTYLTSLAEGTYKGAVKVRLGGEYAFDVLRLRAGYQLQTSPYQVKADDINDLQQTISIGLGIRKEAFFLDLAYSLMLRNQEYIPYAAEAGSPLQMVNVHTKRHMIMATLGFRF